MARGKSSRVNQYVPKAVQRRVRHSLVYLILFTTLLVFLIALYKGGLHLVELEPKDITIAELPSALFMSLTRIVIAYFVALFFAFAFGLLAARTALGERILLPLLDVLQSIPIVGFLPAAISFFIGVTQGHRIGVEAAAIFLIFTSQAWNMGFSVYETTKTIPQDQIDAVDSLGVRGSLRFWKLYLPICIPRLVFNSILSWSNGWFFLVACEIIAVGPIQYHLPGIGSFLALAAEQNQLDLLLWGLLALTSLILSLDYLIWRPATEWAERFRQDQTGAATESGSFGGKQVFRTFARVLAPFQASIAKMAKVLGAPLLWALKEVLMPLFWDLPLALGHSLYRELKVRIARPTIARWNMLVQKAQWINLIVLWSLGAAVGLWTGLMLFRWLSPPWPSLVAEFPLAILASTSRIVVSLVISLLWILPVVYWCWNRPKLRQGLTTIAQIGASLPAIALFPLIILVMVRRFGGGMEIASILLLLNGMQWYLLFNALGGASTIPSDLVEATRALGLSRRQTFKRLVLPAIRPALLTGAITAWGGGWNALVVSEYVKYNERILTVNGIGSLMSRSVYELGDSKAIGLCIAAMIGWILIINTVIWRPAYQTASERYKLDH